MKKKTSRKGKSLNAAKAPLSIPVKTLQETLPLKYRMGAVGLVAVIAALLYFANLKENPFYYYDEAVNSFIGATKLKSLSGGETRLFAIKHADYPRMSGYTFLVGLTGAISGNIGFSARNLAAACGVIFAVFTLLLGFRLLSHYYSLIAILAILFTSIIGVIQFRYGFNASLIAAALTVIYYLTLILGEETIAGRRFLWTLLISVVAFINILNELFIGSLVFLLFLAYGTWIFISNRKKAKPVYWDYLALITPVVFIALALFVMFKNPYFGEEVSKMFSARGNLSNITGAIFFKVLGHFLSTNKFIGLEPIFIFFAFLSIFFAGIYLALKRQFLGLLGFIILLAPFILFTSLIGENNFYFRVFVMYFPALFISLIYLLRFGVEGILVKRYPAFFSQNKAMIGGAVLIAGLILGGLRLSQLHSYYFESGDLTKLRSYYFDFPNPQNPEAQMNQPHKSFRKYFNDIAYDANFIETVAYINSTVPENQLILSLPHLIPFYKHTRVTDFFYIGFCEGLTHNFYYPQIELYKRRAYDCRIEDAAVAVLHPVIFEHDAHQPFNNLEKIRGILSGWKLQKTFGNYRVYQNPGK